MGEIGKYKTPWSTSWGCGYGATVSEFKLKKKKKSFLKKVDIETLKQAIYTYPI